MRVKWQDLRVGDIVHLSNNETVPADILLLRTSDPHGVCYIDTCDLDGETNLKRREVSVPRQPARHAIRFLQIFAALLCGRLCAASRRCRAFLCPASS